MSAKTLLLPSTFNRLAWSNLAAQSAEQIALAAAPIVAVLMLGVAEGETGVPQTALTLPFILFAIPAGLLADRISRRKLMAGAEALRAAALAAILVLIALGWLTLPLLALLGFTAVSGTVVYSVTAPALVPSLVTPDLLPAANARIELARTGAFASGPALVGWVGAAPAFGFAAALSVIAVVLLSGLFEPVRKAMLGRHPLARGFRALCGAPLRSLRHRRRHDACDVWRWHGGRRAVRHARDEAARLRHRDRARTRHRLCGLRCDGADGPHPDAVACRLELLPARRGPDPLGDLDHHLTAVGNTGTAAWAGLGDQHPELWRASAGLGARRHRRRTLWRGSLPLSRGRDLRRADAADPTLACGRAVAATPNGWRRLPRLGLKVPLIASRHRLVRGNVGIERVEILGAADTA